MKDRQQSRRAQQGAGHQSREVPEPEERQGAGITFPLTLLGRADEVIE